MDAGSKVAQAINLNSSNGGLTVLLIGNYGYDRQESMQRFAKVLADELPKHGVEVIVCNPAPLFGTLRPSAVGLGKWLGYIDKFIIFPVLLARQLSSLKTQCLERERGLVAHICDHSNAVYVRYLGTVGHLVTCNDLLAVRSALGEIKQNATRWSGRFLQKMILAGLNRAQRVACISEATGSDLLRISKLSPNRVGVIYMGQNHPYHPVPSATARTRIARGLDGQEISDSTFILHVGGNHWYKNRRAVLEIYGAMRTLMASIGAAAIPRLVMIGPSPTSEMNVVLDRQPELKAEVVFLQDITNEELAAFYSVAELLLFPSIEEGFGWPISEAQACGCRVVTTGKAPMTEVGGDAAAYLSPADVDGSDADGFERAARGVVEILNEDHSSRRQRIERGLKNAARFSTDGMVRQYLETYREVILRVTGSCLN